MSSRLLTLLGGLSAGPLNFSHDFVATQGLPSGFSLTRSDGTSAATRINAQRAIEVVAANVARHEFHPVTGAPRGMLIEATRTNSIRNATAAGATAGVIGSGGVLPTNWALSTSTGGLTYEVLSVTNGVLRLRISGTTSGTTLTILQFEPNTQIAAVSGQNWFSGLFAGLVSGSIASATTQRIAIRERSSGGTTLQQTNQTISMATGNVFGQRWVVSRSLTDASTAAVGLTLDLGWPSGTVVDVTLDLGWAQLEGTNAVTATSAIRTTGSSTATRASELLLANTPYGNITTGLAGVSVYAEVEYMSLGTASGQRIFELGVDGNNRMGVGILSGGNIGMYITNGGASVTANGVVGPTAGTIYKIAATFQVGSCSICVNGGSVASVTAAAIPAYDKIAIGSASTGGSNLSGWARAFAIQSGVLSATAMQAITR